MVVTIEKRMVSYGELPCFAVERNGQRLTHVCDINKLQFHLEFLDLVVLVRSQAKVDMSAVGSKFDVHCGCILLTGKRCFVILI